MCLSWRPSSLQIYEIEKAHRDHETELEDSNQTGWYSSSPSLDVFQRDAFRDVRQLHTSPRNNGDFRARLSNETSDSQPRCPMPRNQRINRLNAGRGGSATFVHADLNTQRRAQQALAAARILERDRIRNERDRAVQSRHNEAIRAWALEDAVKQRCKTVPTSRKPLSDPLINLATSHAQDDSHPPPPPLRRIPFAGSTQTTTRLPPPHSPSLHCSSQNIQSTLIVPHQTLLQPDLVPPSSRLLIADDNRPFHPELVPSPLNINKQRAQTSYPAWI
ncbi:hypothetical protein BD289DRAFT_502087 [Coniella lustricola]|uniref:Uncharacterized protein n=1 Tax=Coniella lustricola TaxID=2025994 RepID=A0A2T3AMD4_9PEZI|nr:hypothetical protein BD289DRAFT_502087 [Coniella lustricola]